MAQKRRRRAKQAARGRQRHSSPVDLFRSWWLISAVAVVAGLGALWVYLSYRKPQSTDAPGNREISRQTASYAGAKACAACHAAKYEAWRRSQHASAMQVADDKSVLGNFDNVNFSYGSVISTFFRRDGKFVVNTDGPDGKLRDYEIKYTFGVQPLQQYLIELPDGRIQALSIAWDTRPSAQGGQRWFHLYPEERITYDDELHWTHPAQNWNFMCADCHSTGLRKNYDPANDDFKTQWEEINVGCEACHGPGSRHLEWARLEQGGQPSADRTLGLTVNLHERREVTWSPNPATGSAVRSGPPASGQEIEVCAQCHSRRSQIAEGYVPGDRFLDYYRPSLITSPLYYPDGQQRGEVYKWGSFLQSKMYASGVTCANCHEPHSGTLRAKGNAVCTQCHAAGKYDTSAHHHHKSGATGASCTACHMPTTTYMVVDPRHDHSLRVPRPDLSVELGTPNACNGCHKSEDAQWAAARVRDWYGHNPEGYQRFAPAFAAANEGKVNAQAELRAVATDTGEAAIARASAWAQVEGPLSRATLDALGSALRSGDPLVRFGALQTVPQAGAKEQVALASPLLSDPLRTLRMEASSLLAGVPREQLTAEQQAAFQRAAREYMESQRYNGDRAEARVNLGTFFARQGNAAEAEKEMRAAIRLEPLFVPAYVNLADLYRAMGRDADGEKILREGLRVAPQSAVLHHALGLALVRLKRMDDAVAELGQAAALEPGNARFTYVYAVALKSTGHVEKAIATLRKALSVHPNDRDILGALVSFHAERGEGEQAQRYAQRLKELDERLKNER